MPYQNSTLLLNIIGSTALGLCILIITSTIILKSNKIHLTDKLRYFSYLIFGAFICIPALVLGLTVITT